MKIRMVVVLSALVFFASTSAEKWDGAPGSGAADGLTLPYSGVANTSGFAFGITNQAQGDCTGIIGSSWGASGKGIHGIATSNTDDAGNYGGYFQARGGLGIGVYGEASSSSNGKNYGGFFLSKGTRGQGVSGISYGDEGIGVYGIAHGGQGAGVFGTNSESHYSGFLGTKDYGVRSDGPVMIHGAGIRVENAHGYPIMTIDGPSGWNTDFWGKVVVRSRPSGNVILELGEGLDYAEGFNVTNGAEAAPGSVLIIDPDHPGRLRVSESEYDRRVAGVVCGGNGNAPGVRLGVQGFDRDVALAGRVYCNVDTSYGEVKPGDLLTTSPTPGFAMVVRDYSRAQGAILGKAMENLAEGRKGQVLVLVALQ
jgi:hypothetical protein